MLAENQSAQYRFSPLPWTVARSDNCCLGTMNSRLAIGVIAIVGVSVCGLVSTFVHFEIVDRVNEKLPAEEQYSWLGWHTDKVSRLFSDYRRLCPNGGLIRRFHLISAMGAGFLVVSAWAFRFFAK
jgi:hypothetical protein